MKSIFGWLVGLLMVPILGDAADLSPQDFAFGLPVVTEEGNHPPEIGYLKPGRNGFMVPQNDLGRLREKIFYLLENDPVRGEFSRTARADILREGSTEGMFQGFLKSVQFLSNHNS